MSVFIPAVHRSSNNNHVYCHGIMKKQFVTVRKTEQRHQCSIQRTIPPVRKKPDCQHTAKITLASSVKAKLTTASIVLNTAINKKTGVIDIQLAIFAMLCGDSRLNHFVTPKMRLNRFRPGL